MGTRVRTLLEGKGRDVLSIASDRTLNDAVAVLSEKNVGALVVTDDGEHLAGILSERDILRRLARSGAACLDQKVADVMTTEVTTCDYEVTTDELMRMMTEGRFRHVPVIEDGVIVGLVSIGDVVKSRMNELETATEQLEQYVTGTSY